MAGHLPGRALEDYVALATASFWEAEEGVPVTLIKGARGEVTDLRVRHDDGWERAAPRIGPLIHSLVPKPDSDPVLGRKLEGGLKAIAQGRKAVEEAQGIARGRKKNYSSANINLLGLRSLSFIAAQDVGDRIIERHDAHVSRILYYRLMFDKIKRYVLACMTADGLGTDTDLVYD